MALAPPERRQGRSLLSAIVISSHSGLGGWPSAIRREDNAPYQAFTVALSWSTDVSTAIWGGFPVNHALGNRRQRAVQSHLVDAVYLAALGRAAIRLAAARTLAVISSELRIEVPMPFVVADPVMPFLCACACTKESRERAKKSRDEPAFRHSMPPARMEARAFSLANV
jgi:hypothetical protein